MLKRLTTLLIIALAVVGLDQLTKALIVGYLPGNGFSLIDGLLRFMLVYNKGAAFGFMSTIAGGRWFLTIISLVALGFCIALALGPWGRRRLGLWSLALICGGAVGNLIDRLRLGMVIDFIEVYYGQWHFPSFNVADSAITVGGFLLAYLLLRGKL